MTTTYPKNYERPITNYESSSELGTMRGSGQRGKAGRDELRTGGGGCEEVTRIEPVEGVRVQQSGVGGGKGVESGG